MKRTLLALLAAALSFTASSAEARDSTCLLGDDGGIAITTLEHRAGEGRATDVLLVFGSHYLTGLLDDTDSGKISLKSLANGADDSFNGNISVNYESQKITLKGKLKLDGEAYNIDTSFECKELDPNQALDK